MSVTMDDSIKGWTAKRKTVLVIEIIEGAGPRWPRPAGPSTCRPPGLRAGSVTRSGDGEFPAGEPARHPRAIREAVEGSSGGLWRGHAGAAFAKKYQALPDADDK